MTWTVGVDSRIVAVIGSLLMGLPYLNPTGMSTVVVGKILSIPATAPGHSPSVLVGTLRRTVGVRIGEPRKPRPLGISPLALTFVEIHDSSSIPSTLVRVRPVTPRRLRVPTNAKKSVTARLVAASPARMEQMKATP